MAKDTKREVLVFGYPNRVREVSERLAAKGIVPVQVGVLEGSWELLAKLKFYHALSAVVLYGGPVKKALLSVVKQVRELTQAPILVVLLEHTPREESLKKAGAAEVFQRAGNISAEEVVEQLVQMLKSHRSSRHPRTAQHSTTKPVSMPVSQMDDVDLVDVGALQAEEGTLETVVVSPRAMVVPEPKHARSIPPEVARKPVAQNIVLVPPAKNDGPHEGLEIGSELSYGRRTVVFHGRKFSIPVQLCTLLRLLYQNKQEGVRMEQLYGIGMLNSGAAAVAIGNLRKQLVKVNRQWGDALKCIDGIYYLTIPPDR